MLNSQFWVGKVSLLDDKNRKAPFFTQESRILFLMYTLVVMSIESRLVKIYRKF